MQTVKFSYRNYIDREFQRRLKRNVAYSLRAYARDLGLSPSSLSEILNGRSGLGESTAQGIIKALRLSETESQHFLTLVESEHSRSATRRALARQLLKKISEVNGYSEIDLEKFKIISDWHHNAILELTEVHDFKSDPRWISERLGVPLLEVKEAIQRLLDCGLLENKNGRLVQTHAHLATPSDIPNREICELHHQILHKADRAVEARTVAERDLSAVTMAIGVDQIPLAKKRIKEFRRQLSLELQEASPKDSVYCLSIQFFPLDEKGLSK